MDSSLSHEGAVAPQAAAAAVAPAAGGLVAAEAQVGSALLTIYTVAVSWSGPPQSRTIKLHVRHPKFAV